jgi:hypothetical protein
MPFIRRTTHGARLYAGVQLLLACWILLSSSCLRAQSGFNVLSYAAIPDGILRTDGAILAGSATLTSLTGSFTSSDVGKYVEVIGAGPGAITQADASMAFGSAVLNSPSGAFAASDAGKGIIVIGAGANGGNLVTTIEGYTSPTSVTLNAAAGSVVASARYFYGAMTLEATIQSVQSSTSVTLSAAGAATITSATYVYGTENHSAFQAALDAAGQAGGGIVRVPAPASCPSQATCGYVIKPTDFMTAKAPGAVKIRYSNVSLIGDAPQTNLFCRGAWGTYVNSVSYPGQTAVMRGACLSIGDNGGPNGQAGTAVSNITVAKLHLYGMTGGNTFNNSFSYPPVPSNADGWDITHKAIYMWDNSTFSNITIDSVVIQDFKAENIYSGGSVLTGMVIKNSTLKNFNGNGISMLAADLQVLNNTITNGANAAVENSTESTGATALVRQLYQNNTISYMAREGIVVVGVDGGIAAGSVQLLNNYFDTIGEIRGSGAQTAIYIASQNNGKAPSNVTITGNTCHDCFSFGVLFPSGATQVATNTFIVDQYRCNNFLSFLGPMTNVTIANNSGYATANAQANGLTMAAVYMLNPGYASGGFAWNNVFVQGNSWVFPGTPQYEFVTTSGLGWNIVTLYNLTWKGDSCNGCTHSDTDHGMVDLTRTTTIEPLGPTIYAVNNSSAVTATINTAKEQDGSQIQIVNAGSKAINFVPDSNMSLTGPVTVPGGANTSITFAFNAAIGKFALFAGIESITPTSGTPQSAAVNTAFGTTLQATVTDAGGNPLSGVTVTFSAPGGGPSAAFAGGTTANAVTAANGVATSPALAANSLAGSYVVTASVAGVVVPASFSLSNTAGSPNAIGSISGTPQRIAVNTAFATPLQALVKDSAGNPVGGATVIFAAPGSGPSGAFGGSATASVVTSSSGIATAPALTANSQAGSYTVTATADGVSLPANFNLTNTAVSSGAGSLIGSGNSSAGLVNVTAEGGADWEHWGDASTNRKLGVTAQIEGYTTVGTGAVLRYANDPRPISWADGVPTLSSTSNQSGVYISGVGQGFSFTAPADTAVRSLTVHVGGWFSGGTLTAHLTDQSAPDFVDVTATSAGQYDRNYAITYQAGSAAQSLIVSWVMTSGTGNVTLNAAALGGTTTSGSVIASGGTPQSAAVGAVFGTSLKATVTDSGGKAVNGATVTFTVPSSGPSAVFSGSSSVTTNTNGVATAPALTANNLAGGYTVTASVAGGGVATFSLTNTGPATSGALQGTVTNDVTSVNLTVDGSTDWEHWGDGILNRKAGVTPQLSTYIVVGSGTVFTYSNDDRPVSWTDGAPTASSSNDKNGIYIRNRGQGFSFTAPADTSVRTLGVHVGGWSSAGALTAHLSDGSAVDFTDASAMTGSQYDRNYTLSYHAASAGQTLTVTWTMTSGNGNVTLNAVTLH